LNPHDRNTFLPCPLNKSIDVRNDGIAFVSCFNNAVLDINDDLCGVRSVFQSGHGLISFQ
jgi:hypothetical protein